MKLKNRLPQASREAAASTLSLAPAFEMTTDYLGSLSYCGSNDEPADLDYRVSSLVLWVWPIHLGIFDIEINRIRRDKSPQHQQNVVH
jgi:hypothetical protein